MDFELHRSGGPGSGPSLSLEQQQQLEMQRELERQQLQVQQFPEVLQTLDKQLENNPKTQALLKRFEPEEQDEIKKALTQGVTERIGPNGLRRIDLLTTTNDGGLYIRFNRSHSVTLHGDQLPGRESGQEERPANVERPVPTERQNEPARQPLEPAARERDIAQPERASPERSSSVADRQQEPAYSIPEPARYTGNLTLDQRQQQEMQNTPLDASQVTAPKFENGILAVQPIPYRNPFGPQPISHEPQQRQADIQQQLEPKLSNVLDGYNPAEQNQLKQALSEEISDLTGSRLKIDQIELQEDGRLLASLNQGLHQVYLDPQQVLQPERDTSPTREPLSQEEQSRRETQQQIQQQIEQLNQHQPFEQLAIEHRLREAVGDERIESLRIEGEDTIQLGLRNGMALTASSYELLNMTDGRELLNRSQVDPATQSSQSTETGLHDPDSQPSRELAQPIAFTVLDGEGPARIGKRIAPEHADAAAWYVLQSLAENYGKDQDGIHYSPKANRLIIKEGQQGNIDLSSKSEAELAHAAQEFRLHMAKEGKEDVRRDEAAKIAERQRLQAQREQQNNDDGYLQFSLQYLAEQRQLEQNAPQNRITYEQKPINYYATNLHAMGLDPASEDAYISRRNREGGWTGVTAAALTAKRTFYEGWNILTLGAVKAQDELVLQHNHNLITDEQYNRGTLWNAGSKTAMVLAGGWMARTGGAQAMELKTLTQSVKTPWPYVGAGVSGGADALGQYYRDPNHDIHNIRLAEVAMATGSGFLLTPYAMRANIAGNGIIGATNGLANASFQNAYYGDKNDLAKATYVGSALGAGGAYTGVRVQSKFSTHDVNISALLQPPLEKTQGYIFGNISSMLPGTTGNFVNLENKND